MDAGEPLGDDEALTCAVADRPALLLLLTDPLALALPITSTGWPLELTDGDRDEVCEADSERLAVAVALTLRELEPVRVLVGEVDGV